MIDMVILDTLSDVFAGDENDRQQVCAFIPLLARLGLKTQLTTPTAGASLLTGMVSRTLPADRDQRDPSAYVLHGDRGGTIDTRILQVMKANYGPKNLCVKLRWQRGLYVPVTEAAQHGEEKYSAEAADECFLRLLRRLHQKARAPR